MALFGRESQADLQRAERVTRWLQARHPLALLSAMFGLLAAVDAITGVLGVAFGVVAIVLGVMGLRRVPPVGVLADRCASDAPHWSASEGRPVAPEPLKQGRRLCLLGIILGGVGIAVGALVWTIR